MKPQASFNAFSTNVGKYFSKTSCLNLLGILIVFESYFILLIMKDFGSLLYGSFSFANEDVIF